MTSKNRRSWTPEQKSALVSIIEKRHKAGESFAQVARELGIGVDNVRRWMRGKRVPNMAVVQLRESTPVVLANPVGDGQRDVRSHPQSVRVGLVAPDGFRFEGLSVDEALELYRRLR